MARGGRAPSRRRALALFGGVAAAVLVIDQVTKHLVVVELSGEPPVRLLGGAVYLTLVRNSGAAFSMFRDHTWVFPVITIGVVVAIAVAVRKLAALPWAVALGLVLGGALGNLGDRLFRSPGPFVGHVVDMVSVFDGHGRYFPVFNAADSALCIGVVLIAILELSGRRRDGTRINSAKRPAEPVADVRG